MSAGSILAWVQVRHPVRLHGPTARALLTILEHAGEYPTLADLLGAHGLPASTVRLQFAKKLLPSPKEWFVMAKGLYVAQEVQRHPSEYLTTIALGIGYSGHSSVTHTLRRRFGMRPDEVRETKGWEPLVAAWWTRMQSRTLTRSAA